MDHSIYREFLEEDMQRLEALFASAARSDAELQNKIAGKGDLRLLDLACGACDEAKTLAKIFGADGRQLSSGRNMEFVGLDVRAREIADASARFAGDSKAAFEFINGDATKLEEYRQLEDGFDVVFMRHQNLWNGKRTWEEIYQKALQKLSPNGRLIITSYFDREHVEALDVLENQGGELIVSQANANSRRLEVAGKSVDRHLAILKRAE